MRVNRAMYPKASLHAGEQGVVKVRISLDPMGIVEGLKIVRSSGYPLLDQAAMAEFTGMTCDPLMVDGKPSRESYTIPVAFALHGGPGRTSQ